MTPWTVAKSLSIISTSDNQLKQNNKFNNKLFVIGDIVSINENEFIVTIMNRSKGIWKYNIHMNKFVHFCHYPHTVANFLDHDFAALQQHQLYLYNNRIHMIDIETGEMHSSNKSYHEAGCVLIKNNLHIILNHDEHIIMCYNKLQKKFVNVANNLNKSWPRLSYPSVIYVPSKQCILLLGGRYFNSYGGWGEVSSEVWSYSLVTQSWKQIVDVKFAACYFAAVLTPNEKNILLFGGKNDKEYVDDIFVFNIEKENQYTLKKSTIHCPDVGSCFVVITGGKNHIVVSGYVRQCCTMPKFATVQLLPTWIQNLISEYYSTELVHWIGKSMAHNHYCMQLQDILSTV